MALVPAVLLTACADEGPRKAETLGQARSAAFVNGDFESDTAGNPPASWTVTSFLNPNPMGVTLQTPQTLAGLNLNALTKTCNSNADCSIGGGAYGTCQAKVCSPSPKTVDVSNGMPAADPTLGATASLRVPRFGVHTVLVNQLGNASNVNSLSQTMTISASDVDTALDNKPHVRFVVAPILEDPGHNDNEQPYFYIQLTNVTTGAILYQNFNFSNQSGVPWQAITKSGTTYRYTDWQLIDISPATGLDVGNQVKLEIYGAGCSLGGHMGEVYVDGGIGASIPGIFVSGSAPATATDGSNLTYTLSYKNGSSGQTTGTTVDFTIPPNTTFQSINANGYICTGIPAIGAGTGTISCVVGKTVGAVTGVVAAGDTGSFTVTVKINPGFMGTVVEQLYDIKAASVSPLIGSKVVTQVTAPADLQVTLTDNDPNAYVTWGQAITYTATVTNAGPDAVTGATISNPVPTNLTGVTWTCTATGGATCPAASGNGAITATANIPSGGKLTYTINGTVVTGMGSGTLSDTFTATDPATNTDPAPANNSVNDTHAIKSINGVGCTTGTDCVSNVCDTDKKCGYDVPDGPCTQNNGSVVCRSGMCSVSGFCEPTGGCDVDADCSGNAAMPWCMEQTHICKALLPNGTLIPSDPGHNPVLNNKCSTAAGKLVCQSGVCDTGDDKCGFQNGDGPCTLATGPTVCRSGICSMTSGLCVPATGGCGADSDCGSDQWCDIAVFACAPKVLNGGVLPSDPGHKTPTINGTCSDAAAKVVCVSAACDENDNRCGYLNGDGSCDSTSAATVCRSGACDPDGKCGFANGDGPCVAGNGAPCRSGECSAHASVCVPVGGCAVDADCGASEWCNTDVFACTPKLPNGKPVPTVGKHTPPLTGTCDAASGAAVCASAVCDTHDNDCGYADGDGPCNLGNGPSVCRSGICGNNGTCSPAPSCTQDSDCKTATEYCDTGASKCAPKLPNGQPLPTVSGHTPTLDGTCSTTEAPVVCLSAVCDTDNACGYKNGDGPCTTATAGTVCRSSTCSPNGSVCIPSGGCAVDADCLGTEWCNTQSFTCAPKLVNGAPIPTVTGHTPGLTGICSSDVAKAVCFSAVCDTNDNDCGFANGDGPCTAQNGATVCRSGLCDATSGKCQAPKACTVDSDCDAASQYCNTPAKVCAPKLPNDAPIPVIPGHAPTVDGSCSDDSAKSVCLSGVCDQQDNRCGHAIGNGPCATDSGATVCRSGLCGTGALAGVCVECLTDAACTGTLTVCDPVKDACVQCTSAESTACQGATPICGKGLDTCAPCDGDFGGSTPDACSTSGNPHCFLTGPSAGQCGKCTTNDDCSGGTCDTSTGACVLGCLTDSDCDATHWCDADGAPGACQPKLENGKPLPSSPTSVKTCTDAVGKRVCASGACDKADDTCGFANGDGPCTDGTVCRSTVCDSADKKCGYANGDGPCTDGTQCRSDACDSKDQKCGYVVGDGPCDNDAECRTGTCDKVAKKCSNDNGTGGNGGGSSSSASSSSGTGGAKPVIDASGNGILCSARPGSSGGAEGLVLLGAMAAIYGARRRRNAA